MIFNLMKPVPTTESATMYLYGHEADKTVSYNGVALPELPEWDKEQYPYAFIYYKDTDSIVSVSHYAYLYLCANPITAYEGGMESMPYITITKLQITGSYLKYGMVSNEKMLESVTEGMSSFLGELAYLSKANIWEHLSADENKSMDYGVECIWANHDVVHTNGTVTISATEPIIYTNADVTIGGVGYVGAILPKLPEWDKTAYPYAYIKESYVLTDYYTLVLLKEPYALDGTTLFADFIVEDGETFLESKHDGDNGTWGAMSEETTDSTDDSHELMRENMVWANFDLVTEGGSVLLSASDPIPIYE